LCVPIAQNGALHNHVINARQGADDGYQIHQFTASQIFNFVNYTCVLVAQNRALQNHVNYS